VLDDGMNRLDQIEASMGAAKDWKTTGAGSREHAKANADSELVRLALLLAEATEDLGILTQTRRIVDTYNSI
jgi:hypothetical protein